MYKYKFERTLASENPSMKTDQYDVECNIFVLWFLSLLAFGPIHNTLIES